MITIINSVKIERVVRDILSKENAITNKIINIDTNITNVDDSILLKN
jgi:hypothetical protein